MSDGVMASGLIRRVFYCRGSCRAFRCISQGAHPVRPMKSCVFDCGSKEKLLNPSPCFSRPLPVLFPVHPPHLPPGLPFRRLRSQSAASFDPILSSHTHVLFHHIHKSLLGASPRPPACQVFSVSPGVGGKRLPLAIPSCGHVQAASFWPL